MNYKKVNEIDVLSAFGNIEIIGCYWIPKKVVAQHLNTSIYQVNKYCKSLIEQGYLKRYYELKEKLEASEKARKELEDKINKTNDYINKNPLVCVGDYEYFVNDIMQMESFSNKMSFIRTLKENLDIDKGE